MSDIRKMEKRIIEHCQHREGCDDCELNNLRHHMTPLNYSVCLFDVGEGHEERVKQRYEVIKSIKYKKCITRPSVDEYYLNIAKAVSKRSSCIVRQYGAVIVKNDEVISTGYNGSPRGSENCCDIGYCKRYSSGSHSHNDGDYNECESVHAEMNSLLSASRNEMIGATLYLYGSENDKPIDCEPCPICKRLIKNAGIIRVVGVIGGKLNEV